MRRKSVLTPLLLPALIVALDAIGATPALAQGRVLTLDEIRREVIPGDLITVVQTTGDSLRGRLLRFGDDEFDLRPEAGRGPGRPRRMLDVTIPYSGITSLERPRDSSRNGAMIGAGIGGGVAVAMFVRAVAVDRNEIDEWAASYLAFGTICTGIGALAGWAIDSARSRPHVSFKAPAARTRTVRAVPVLSRRPGVALVLLF